MFREGLFQLSALGARLPSTLINGFYDYAVQHTPSIHATFSATFSFYPHSSFRPF